jgi:ArsR family transcriptional regulator, virulence genes transcriptional regulator
MRRIAFAAWPMLFKSRFNMQEFSMSKSPDQRERFIMQSTALLTAMANASRIEILDILIREEISVRPLSEKVRLSQSALSQHLAKLRDAGLVKTRRDAQTIYYSSHSEAVARVLLMLRQIAGLEISSNTEVA